MYRLVVIDDEYIVVEGIKAMIARQKLDYQVVGWAYDGIKGLEVVQEQKPDLVITDIRIPGLDGLSLIEEARETCPDTEFVVISGYTEFEYARRALALGVRGYIDKPISIDKLEEVLGRVERDCFQVKSDNSAIEKDRKEQEELKALFDQSVQALIDSNVEEFQVATEKSIGKIQGLYTSTEEYRREIYKYLCVLCDILAEVRSNVSRDTLVSYQVMEEQKSDEDILSYSKKIITDVMKYLEADKTGSSHGVILELLAYIEEHYAEDIGLNELADRVGMSPAYLSVLFKSEVGTSYVKYLTGLRMKQAKKLLKQGYKVNQVAETVGYNNYRYFCDIFKKQVGQTPSEYKNQF